MDTASNGSLDSEFGTHKEEDVVKAILEKGTVQESEVRHPYCRNFASLMLSVTSHLLKDV